MNEFEDHGPQDVPDFDDPTHADLRALLADVAAPAMPPEVVARLDATLADLVAGTAAASGGTSTVVPLRRRRPLGQRLLVAAAAVVLVGAGGVGVAQVLDRTSQGDSFATSGTAQKDAAAEAPAAPGLSAPEVTGDSLSGLGANLQRESYATAKRLAGTEFTRAGFAQQVRRFVDETARASGHTADAGGLPAEPTTAPTPENQSGSGAGTTGDSSGAAPTPVSGSGPWFDAYDRDLNDLSTATKASRTCAGPATPDGAVSLGITFEGRPAVLVLHPVADGSRYVAAWSCDGHQLLTYATILA